MEREDGLTPDERLDAVADILARGVHRVVTQERNASADNGGGEERTETEAPPVQ